MPDNSNNPARPGFHTITPYLTIDDLDGFLSFIGTVFEAEETPRMQGRGGGTHVEVRIGNSMLMIGSGGSWRGHSQPAAIYVHINDVNASYRAALNNGATEMMEPSDEPDDDRRAGVQDSFGNMWFIARPLG
jgi:PhnB protein